MKNLLRWMISFALLVAAPAMADPTNANPTSPLAGITCQGSNCKGTPNGPANPFYVSGTSGSDATKLALDATMQSILAALDAPLTFNLPTNAATATNQATANGYLLTLSGFTTSASTSALQSTGNGFLSTLATASASQATGAKQDTGNGSLATIATNSGTQATAAGQATGNASAATTATNTGTTATQTTAINTATGAQADAAYSGSGSSSIIAALKGIYAKLAGTLTVSGTVTTTPSGTQTVSGSVTSGGYTLTGSPAPISVTTSSAAATGLTLPGKVRFQASPVTTLGGGTINTVAIQINYAGGNACTQPSVILGAGQIDDWVNITTSTAPTVCAASTTTLLVTQ